jgi:hypothetical protein
MSWRYLPNDTTYQAGLCHAVVVVLVGGQIEYVGLFTFFWMAMAGKIREKCADMN